jgi:isopenicillin N synthase-like dioxygenase
VALLASPRAHRISTTERRGFSRYSMPFFLHFRSDYLIGALPGTVPPGEAPRWPPITANDYLQERLRENKLK